MIYKVSMMTAQMLQKQFFLQQTWKGLFILLSFPELTPVASGVDGLRETPKMRSIGDYVGRRRLATDS